MIDFKDRVVLITGAGAGIGRACALKFGELGARIIALEIDAARVESLRKTLAEKKIEAIVAAVDVRQRAQVEPVIAEVRQRYGALDVLINNVGDFLGQLKPFEESTEDEWDALYQVNLRHMFVVTKAALPLLRQSKNAPSIINLSSIEAFRACPHVTVYCSFKTAVTGFTRSLACELGPAGIRVNAIALEGTETEQMPLTDWVKPENRAQIKYWSPMGRFGRTSDIVGCAIFLASELASWTTGSTVLADGGALAAGGFYRTPDDRWTILPLISGSGMGPL